MRDYFTGPDGMEMIQDQIRANPLLEISKARMQDEPFCDCFEEVDMKKLTWDGQHLHGGDIVYYNDQKGCFWMVRMSEEKLDPKESKMATIEENLQNALAFQKAEREAQICNGACDVPFEMEGK